MINGSFVFGMDDDDQTVFDRTVEWAISQGIETATFHILTPYPSTALYQRLKAQDRIVSDDWDLFDTRHVVFKPAKLTPETLEAGYWRAYADFYKWGSILRGASAKTDFKERLRHVAYAGGWKKLEPFWDWVIRAKRVTSLLPMLEAVLTGFGSHRPSVRTYGPARLTHKGALAVERRVQSCRHCTRVEIASHKFLTCCSLIY